jgi:hypothetical protein
LADPFAARRICLVDLNLRGPLEPAFGTDSDVQERCVDEVAGDGQDGDRRMLGESIGLDDQSRSRLTVIARKRDDDEITPASCAIASDEAASQASSSVRVASVSLSRIRRDCRRHSSANSGARVFGTQSWMGRNPAARSLARRRSTRSDRDIGFGMLTSRRYM